MRCLSLQALMVLVAYDTASAASPLTASTPAALAPQCSSKPYLRPWTFAQNILPQVFAWLTPSFLPPRGLPRPCHLKHMVPIAPFPPGMPLFRGFSSFDSSAHVFICLASQDTPWWQICLLFFFSSCFLPLRRVLVTYKVLKKYYLNK